MEVALGAYKELVVALPLTARFVEVAAVKVPVVSVTGPKVAAMLVASSLPPVKVRP